MFVRALHSTHKFSLKTLVIYLTVFLVGLGTTIQAQIDTTFGTNGVTLTNPGPGVSPIGSFVLPDGKIFVVVKPTSGSSSVPYFFRSNADGTPDTTYAPNGFKQIAMPFGGSARAAARQADGKIVLVGNHNSQESFVARFNQDGTLDTSFRSTGYHQLNIAASNTDGLLSVTVQPDGKIVSAGFARVSSTNRLVIVRHTVDGFLDPSVNGNGILIHDTIGYSDTIDQQQVYINSADQILVACPREPGGGKIRRFNFDGTIDGSFTLIPYPFVDSSRRTLSYQQSDDKILVSGIAVKNETLLRTHDDVVVYRYNADGTPDTGFGTNGSTSFDITSYFRDEPLGFQVAPNGDIVVVVETSIPFHRAKLWGNLFGYVKLTSSGTLIGKVLGTHEGNSATEPSFTHVLPDGKVLTVFTFNPYLLLTRMNGIPIQTYTFRGLPYNFPSGAGGVPAKPSLFRPSDSSWRPLFGNTATFGLPEDIPISGDFVGDMTADYAVYRPSTSTFYISNNDWSGTITDFTQVQWGLSGDVPATGDYDGDGKSDIAVFRPSNGVWYIRHSADNSFRFVQWGLNGDKPAVGDFDGDGKDDISLFRPSDGNWYIIKSSDGGFIFTHFGLDGDIPVQEDYDNDEKFDIAVYRPTSGVWYILNSGDGSFLSYQWGLPGDIPVPAEYDRDEKMNIAVWRPSNGFWYIVNPDLTSMHFYTLGQAGDIPLPGRF